MCCFYEAKTLKLRPGQFPLEPPHLPDKARVVEECSGEPCPVCQGQGRLRCRHCQAGRVPFLGGFQQCGRCHGEGVKPCPVCDGHGLFPAIEATSPVSQCAQPELGLSKLTANP